MVNSVKIFEMLTIGFTVSSKIVHFFDWYFVDSIKIRVEQISKMKENESDIFVISNRFKQIKGLVPQGIFVRNSP